MAAEETTVDKSAYPAAFQEWGRFLQDTAPNVPVTLSVALIKWEMSAVPGREVSSIIVPVIHLHCENDGNVRRFQAGQQRIVIDAGRTFEFVDYNCRDCGRAPKSMAVAIEWDGKSGRLEAMKLGEYPPFGAPVSKRLRQLLGDGEDLFKKAGTVNVKDLE
jgi:hypothetical protein